MQDARGDKIIREYEMTGLKVALAGSVISAAALPVIPGLSIDNKTPPFIGLCIVFLCFLYTFYRLAMNVIGLAQGHNKAQANIAVEMGKSNVLQDETNKRLDELNMKISSKPCLMGDQTVVETTARRISDHLRAKDFGQNKGE